MPHIQEIPAVSKYWDHPRFFGRREGDPSDQGTPDEKLRNWGVIYQAFPSANDAKHLTNKFTDSDCVIEILGRLVDKFFWDEDYPKFGAEGTGAYHQDDARVYATLLWYLTGNPTTAEMEFCPGIEANRAKMLGATVFNFVVTALPAERAAE